MGKASKAEYDVTVSWADIISGVHSIPVDLILPDPKNARTIFDEAEIDEMAKSMDAQGQVATAIVRNIAAHHEGAECFMLVGGERRWRAAKKLGWAELRCEVRSYENQVQVETHGLIENLQRVDLTPLEKAVAYTNLMKRAEIKSVKKLAEFLGMADKAETIRDTLGLMKLTAAVAEALSKGEITYSHAVLISGEEPEDQEKCLTACFETEMVTIGTLPEKSMRVISLKALRGWIQTNLRASKDDEAQAKKEAAARVEAEARTSAEMALEREGERLAGGEAGEAGEVEAQTEPAEATEVQEVPEIAPHVCVGEVVISPEVEAQAPEDERGIQYDVDQLQKWVDERFPGEREQFCILDFLPTLLLELLTARETLEKYRRQGIAQVKRKVSAAGKKKATVKGKGKRKAK